MFGKAKKTLTYDPLDYINEFSDDQKRFHLDNTYVNTWKKKLSVWIKQNYSFLSKWVDAWNSNNVRATEINSWSSINITWEDSNSYLWNNKINDDEYLLKIAEQEIKSRINYKKWWLWAWFWWLNTGTKIVMAIILLIIITNAPFLIVPWIILYTVIANARKIEESKEKFK